MSLKNKNVLLVSNCPELIDFIFMKNKIQQTPSTTKNTQTSSSAQSVEPPAYGIDMVDQESATIQKKGNKTGLPDQLKSGIENLSGLAMDDVRVHYNSSKPAQLQAHAYAQGTDIHLAPGQEKHLAHEAWHVVQQKQGRVKATMQLKGKVKVNDDQGLEREADAMGSKALQFSNNKNTIINSLRAYPKIRNNNLETVTQLETKVKRSNKRAIVTLQLLSDEDLKDLIEDLKNPAGVFDLFLDQETNAAFLNRAEKALKKRLKVTGGFNVRGRSVKAKGIVLSDDPYVLELAEKNDLLTGSVKNLKYAHDYFVKNLGFNWKEIFDQSLPLKDGTGYARTIFYGEKELEERGPRQNPAAFRQLVLKVPPQNQSQLISMLTITEPCKRGDERQTRDKAMGGHSALNYAIAASMPNAAQGTWEWLHLVGSAIGGDNKQGNLVAGTYDANTLMIPMEQAIVTYSHRADVTPQNPMTVVAEAKLWSNGTFLTYVAETITLKVYHKGKNVFSFGPIQALNNTPLSRMEYDFFAYIFRKMASQ